VALNGRAVADLDALAAELRGLAPGQPLRVELLDLQGRSELLTLKPDNLYWPAFEMRRGPEGWARRSL
jgi:hypothetical protein